MVFLATLITRLSGWGDNWGAGFCPWPPVCFCSTSGSSEHRPMLGGVVLSSLLSSVGRGAVALEIDQGTRFSLLFSLWLAFFFSLERSLVFYLGNKKQSHFPLQIAWLNLHLHERILSTDVHILMIVYKLSIAFLSVFSTLLSFRGTLPKPWKNESERSKVLWFWSFHLGLDAAKWKQCAHHWVGQTEGTASLWSFRGVDLTTTAGPLRERGINSVKAFQTQSWGTKEKGELCPAVVGSNNVPVRNTVNSSAPCVVLALSNPSVWVCPSLPEQLWTDGTPYPSGVRGGVRAETIILTDVRFGLNGSRLSFQICLGVKKLMWHVNNLQLWILFNTWISPCGWNRKPSKVENLINAAICMDWNDNHHVSLNHL